MRRFGFASDHFSSLPFFYLAPSFCPSVRKTISPSLFTPASDWCSAIQNMKRENLEHTCHSFHMHKAAHSYISRYAQRDFFIFKSHTPAYPNCNNHFKEKQLKSLQWKDYCGYAPLTKSFVLLRKTRLSSQLLVWTVAQSGHHTWPGHWNVTSSGLSFKSRNALCA